MLHVKDVMIIWKIFSFLTVAFCGVNECVYVCVVGRIEILRIYRISIPTVCCSTICVQFRPPPKLPHASNVYVRERVNEYTLIYVRVWCVRV